MTEQLVNMMQHN